MREYESEKFEKYGRFFFLLVFGLGIVLPIVISLIIGLVNKRAKIEILVPMTLVFAFIIWMIMIMMIGYGSLTSFFVKRTAKGLSVLPYNFNSSFKGRGGMLYIDVENGMIGYISAYNPMKIQIFNATRISNPKTKASTMSGVYFMFNLDGKKMKIPTLISNRGVDIKSGIGAEAVIKADTFVNILLAAKQQAESRQ